MSTAKTAAAVGIAITANSQQAQKSIAALNKQLGGLTGNANKADLLSSIGTGAFNGAARLAGSLGAATGAVTKYGSAIAATTGTAAAIGMVDMGVKFATSAATVGRAANQLGIPVQKLSQLQIAATLAGSSADAMTGSLEGLQAATNAAAFGRDNDALNNFKNAGIDPGDGHRGPQAYLAMLPKIADQTQKLAATNVDAAKRFLDFTGIGRGMFNVFSHGSAGLKSSMEEAQKYHPFDEDDVAKGTQLQHVMLGIEERFAAFARIGGNAVAPGLTKFLDEFGHYLATHENDVVQFFDTVEHGLEWLTQPKNLKWIGQQADEVVTAIKAMGRVMDDLQHNPLVRHMLGMDQEQSTSGLTKFLLGTPEEGLHQAWNWITGGSDDKDAGDKSPLATKLRPELADASDRTAEAMGVPKAFAKSIFGAEHGLKEDGSAAISPAGAIGAGQLMPGTAREMGVDPYDLQQNVRGSVGYMHKLLDQFHGNEAAAAAAYNAGPKGAGVQHFADTGDASQLPAETQRYVRDVARREAAFAAVGMPQRPADQAFSGGAPDALAPVPTVPPVPSLAPPPPAPHDDATRRFIGNVDDPPAPAASAPQPPSLALHDAATRRSVGYASHDLNPKPPRPPVVAPPTVIPVQQIAETDPATSRFVNDRDHAPPVGNSAPAATPAAPATSIPAYSADPDKGDGNERLNKLRIELSHKNPPPGAELRVVEADPSQVDVVGVRTMGAMPGAGSSPSTRRGY